MEVFSISGWGGGLGAVSCPAGWVATPNGNCGGPAAAGYRHPLATALQTALNKKGAGLVVDGVIGPLTTDAVNKILGANLSLGQVAEQAAALTARAGLAVAALPPAAPPSPVAPLPVQVAPGELPTGGGWALVGLNALVAGIGVYLTATR